MISFPIEPDIVDPKTRLAHSVIRRSTLHQWWAVWNPSYARIQYVDASNQICTETRQWLVRVSGGLKFHVYIFYFANLFSFSEVSIFPSNFFLHRFLLFLVSQAKKNQFACAALSRDKKYCRNSISNCSLKVFQIFIDATWLIKLRRWVLKICWVLEQFRLCEGSCQFRGLLLGEIKFSVHRTRTFNFNNPQNQTFA